MDESIDTKKIFIQENIENKGYDSFLFTQFLCKSKGKEDFDFNDFTMVEIREGVQQFMNSNTPMSKSIDSSAPPLSKKKEKKTVLETILGLKDKLTREEPKTDKNFDYGFKLPEKIKCQNVEETDLSQYEEIPIKIGFPEKVDRGFLKKSITFFK